MVIYTSLMKRDAVRSSEPAVALANSMITVELGGSGSMAVKSGSAVSD